MRPLACDKCLQPIRYAIDGNVEWLEVKNSENNTSQNFGFRLVHDETASPNQDGFGCEYNSTVEYKNNKAFVSSLPLQNFFGKDGLMLLLEMIAKDNFVNIEVLELIKRIHIPHYEKARKHFYAAIVSGIIEPDKKAYQYFSQEDVLKVAQWADLKELGY